MSKAVSDERMRIQKEIHGYLLENPALIEKHRVDPEFRGCVNMLLGIVHHGESWQWWNDKSMDS